MDETSREKLKAEFAALDEAENSIREGRKPFDVALLAIETVRENLKEKHEVEIAGECEGCTRLLFAGEKGFRYEDGPILCEECSPTYGDAESVFKNRDPADDEDPEDRTSFMRQLETHLAGGGSRTDKIPLGEL